MDVWRRQVRELTKKSLVDQAVEQLREEITAGRWPVGSRIPPEPELMAALGVARNTMREAVRALAHTGMLEVRHGDGTYVRASGETAGVLARRLAPADLLDVVTVRRGLEVEAARQAAERSAPEDLHLLATLHHRPAAADVEARVAGGADFHTAVVRASHNPVLIELYEAMADATRSAMRDIDLDADLPNPGSAAHDELLSAIQARDPERAADAAARHLSTLIDYLRSRLG